MVRRSLDGSYIVAILDYVKMVVTHSVGVMPITDERSVDGYQFDTKCIYYNKNLEVYFGMLREHFLRNEETFLDWQRLILMFGVYDINSNTVRTIRPYFSDKFDFSEAKEHKIRALEISCKHELTFKGPSTNSTVKMENKTVIHEKYNGADEAYFCDDHFYIFQNGSAVYSESGVVVTDGGIEGLREWW